MSNPQPTPNPNAGGSAGISAVLSWLASGGLAVGLVLAVVQCSNERESTRIASIQTYNLSRVAAFRDSGGELDKQLVAFNDAAAEGKPLKKPLEAARTALVDHSVKTYALKDVFSASELSDYGASLHELRKEIERTKDARNAGAVITAMSKMLVLRDRLAKTATEKATA